MLVDPNKPLLRVVPEPQAEPRKGKQRPIPPPSQRSPEEQIRAFGPKFDRLRESLSRDSSGFDLRADPTALAPERLLVFKLGGAVAAFAAAARRVGMELVDEEALDSDEDKDPVAYLVVPDANALAQIESLWRRWTRGEPLAGQTAWRDVFALLRELRPWGPEDRIDNHDRRGLTESIEQLGLTDTVRLEFELVYSQSDWQRREAEFGQVVERAGGRIVFRSRIGDIGYHAFLADLPVAAVKDIVGLAGIAAATDSVMHIRAQSLATSLRVNDAVPSTDAPEQTDLGKPILALLDGFPVSSHRLLDGRINVDDPLDLESQCLVADRKHGTAMASLIVHGDRNRNEPPLPRKIHLVPVLVPVAGDETFPSDQLIVDLIYRVIRSLRDGAEATAPGVLIVNLSLGNRRRPFHGSLSPWAKLLDRLAYQYGILFVVSAGNVVDAFDIPAFSTATALEDASADERAAGVISAIGGLMGQRRLIAPAETVNGITVGAHNRDDVSVTDRRSSWRVLEPFPTISMANSSSALGPGRARSVKPDILMPGCRERLAMQGNPNGAVRVEPQGPSRAAGLKVAAPPIGPDEQAEHYTNGTSAAAALASRVCHRIHDALEAAYGERFLSMSHRHRAVLLKALLAHTAQWPKETVSLIKSELGPPNNRQHARQKENVFRFLGYGMVDADAAVACAEDRATFWAAGEISENQVIRIPIPVPIAMASRAVPHSLSVTLGWFTPIKPESRLYRTVRLKLKPETLGNLGLDSSNPAQPDQNQSNRGTLFHQRWTGSGAASVSDDQTINLLLQREPDQAGVRIDDAVPFGVAVTLEMPGAVGLYAEVRQRLGLQTRIAAR